MENQINQLRTLFDQSLKVFFSEYNKSKDIFDTPYVQRNLDKDLNALLLNKSIWLCGELIDYNEEHITISTKYYSTFDWHQVNYKNQFIISTLINFGRGLLTAGKYPYLQSRPWDDTIRIKLADHSFQVEMIGKFCMFQVSMQDAQLHVCSGKISGCEKGVHHFYIGEDEDALILWNLTINLAEASELVIIKDPFITPAYFGHEVSSPTDDNEENTNIPSQSEQIKTSKTTKTNKESLIIPPQNQKIKTSKRKWIISGIILMIVIAWFYKDLTDYFFPLTLSSIKGEWKVSEVQGTQLSDQDKIMMADFHMLIKEDSLFLKPSRYSPYTGFTYDLLDNKLILTNNKSGKSIPITIIDENNFELSWYDSSFGTIQLKFKRKFKRMM